MDVRRMTREDVAVAIEWAAREGWNPGLHDAECFHAADPDGFLIGFVDGEPAAVISIVKYGQAFSFLGLYIVKPAFRGKGHGIALWNAAIESAGSRAIGLDGVVAQQDNYRKSGFVLAHRNVRYEGRGGGGIASDPSIVRLTADELAMVSSYDRRFFLFERDAFLSAWLAHGTAMGVLQDGRLAGYGVIRACREGMKIGPLFADSPAIAERLFLALRASAPGNTPVYLDVPAVNPEAVVLAERHGMTVVFETARMYKGDAPALPLPRIFGITTFELG